MQAGEEIPLGRAEAQIANVHSVLDRPSQAGDEHRPAATQPFTKDLDAVKLAVRCDGTDDARARGAVAVGVLMWRRIEHRSVGPLIDRHIAADAAVDRRVGCVNAAIENSNLDPLAGTSAPGPPRGDVLDRWHRAEYGQLLGSKLCGVRRAWGMHQSVPPSV